MLVADTDLPGMPAEIKRYTMDEVWAATANFSAYLDPEDLRPAFHGRLSRQAKVAVRLMPLPEEHLEQSKAEFVERITAMSRYAAGAGAFRIGPGGASLPRSPSSQVCLVPALVPVRLACLVPGSRCR